MKVRLGYTVPGGDEVHIPLKHMVITGQTQEAGKTTALEGLIARSQCAALTFVTKRGEGAFIGGRRIAPHLKTRGDWQYVAAILEASRGEKMKFERSWIIKVSKGQTTLEGVHRNVKRELANPKVRGISEGVYTVLDAYLEIVVPEMDRYKWAATVDVATFDHPAGLAVMDLTDMSIEMQHLVIQSSIDYVQQHCQDTLIVIPEAWKFMPQGRSTPAKVAAIAFIRQAAAMRNYLWLDSQDLGGIEKEVLRSVSVWLLGVQRETNEIKRTLDNIPAGTKKPKAGDLASLDLGQFYACWKQEIHKVFAEASWAPPVGARMVATGHLDLTSLQVHRPKKEKTAMDDKERAALIEDERRIRQERDKLLLENEDLRTRMAALESRIYSLDQSERRAAGVLPPKQFQANPAFAPEPAAAPKKPKRLEVGHVVNEIEVQHTIETIRQDTSELSGRCAYMLAKGSFDSPVKAFTVATEMQRRGWDHDYRNVDKVLKRMTEQGFLTVDGNQYQAVAGMKIHIKEAVR